VKILLVNPISQNLSLSSPDLGLGYLATALKKENHDVRILDCVNLQMNFEKFEHHIRHLDFDVIGLKVFSTDLLSVEKSVSIVKKIIPRLSSFWEVLTLRPFPSKPCNILPRQILRSEAKPRKHYPN